MRKKLFSVFITLCMIFTMLPVNVFAAGETMQIEVKTDRTGPLKTGDTVTMTLNIKAPVGLSGIQATVTSDNDNLKIAKKQMSATHYPPAPMFLLRQVWQTQKFAA